MHAHANLDLCKWLVGMFTLCCAGRWLPHAWLSVMQTSLTKVFRNKQQSVPHPQVTQQTREASTEQSSIMFYFKTTFCWRNFLLYDFWILPWAHSHFYRVFWRNVSVCGTGFPKRCVLIRGHTGGWQGWTFRGVEKSFWLSILLYHIKIVIWLLHNITWRYN